MTVLVGASGCSVAGHAFRRCLKVWRQRNSNHGQQDINSNKECTHTDSDNKMKRKKQASLYTVHEAHFSIQEESTKLPIFVADPDSIARILMRSDSNSILALSARFHVAAT